MSTEYINKQEMLGEILSYRIAFYEAREKGTEKPRLPNELAKKFMLLVDGIARRPNFNGYSYLDDMKSEALITCLKKAHYFDPLRSDNPFGFFSQCIFRCFITHIKMEHKNEYIKAKLFHNVPSDVKDSVASDEDFHGEDATANPYFDVDGYERKNFLGRYKVKKEKKQVEGPLSFLLEEDLDLPLEELEIFEEFEKAGEE